MDSLPASATGASHMRLDIARELAAGCPPHLGREIAVTGSVSRGIADDYSDITVAWSDPHVPGVRWTLARRGERVALALRLIWDVGNLLAVLYAVNRVWQPDAKWTSLRVRDLSVQPDRLSDRLNAVFASADARTSITTCFQLIVDTLELVPPPHDVSRALASIRASLQANVSVQ